MGEGFVVGIGVEVGVKVGVIGWIVGSNIMDGVGVLKTVAAEKELPELEAELVNRE